MMTIYTFETVADSWNDYGSTHFNIVAETEKEAWKKPVKLNTGRTSSESSDTG